MSTEKDLEKSLNAVNPSKKGLTPPKETRKNGSAQGNLAARLSPSAHKIATKQVAINDAFDYDTALHMAFLGAGQGGSRIVNSFWNLGYRRVGIFNTTAADFEGLEEEIPKLSLDIGGASKNMALARQAINGRDEEVRDLMQRSWGNSPDCVLICAGLGGGTGSGVILPMVRLARQYMLDKGRPPRVGCIVSLPPVDEGQLQARNTLQAFTELVNDKVSPLIIIDNMRVKTLYSPSITELLPRSNELVSELFHLFNRLAATRSPLITFDRSEFTQLLDGGIVAMGAANIGEVENPADVSKKIKEDLANSVLADVDLRYGRKAACIFVGHKDVLDTLSMDFVDAGFTMLDRIVGSANENTEEPTVIHRGLYPGDEPGLQCYTLISELRPPYARLQELYRKSGIKMPAEFANSVAKHLGVS